MRVGSSADLRSRWSNSRRPAPRTALRAGRAPQTGVARGAAGLHCVRRRRLEDRRPGGLPDAALPNRIDGGGSRHTMALSRSSDAALGGGEAAHDDRNAAVACANAGQPRSCSGTRKVCDSVPTHWKRWKGVTCKDVDAKHRFRAQTLTRRCLR